MFGYLCTIIVSLPCKMNPPANNLNIESRGLEEVDFDSQVRSYVSANRPKLAILTPCYGSLCYVSYVTCLMNTITMFNNYGFPIKVEFCRNDSLVSRARNNLIAKAMSDKETTHFMFIDNDITWNPIDVLKLVLSEKPLVGGVYPIKQYNWGKLIGNGAPAGTPGSNPVQDWITAKNNSQVKDYISDVDMVQNRLVRYNINHVSNVIHVENNLTEVTHLATGFMMIRREMIEKMFIAFPSTKYTDDVGFLAGDENKYAYALFDCGVEDDHYLSEDWMFCSRWKKMGGKIFVDVSIHLNHTGIEDFKGSFIASILN